ncbi:MAG: D-sedoheptulose 7-phosphate isomerase [Candidatus Omnitrophica bacterium]|nr:D-sedoheptulose 7-phosphate isomerase [Candidatus Omnitrophota bacterium]
MRDLIVKSIEENIAAKKAVLAQLVPSIEKAANLVVKALQNGNKILFFGNGGSASDSQHLAAEFVGRYEKERRGLASVALTTDTSILTAVGNDYGFEKIFERQVESLGRPGDVAVGLSTTGNSKNVVRGLARAKALGLVTIALTGRTGGELKNLADLSLIVPSQKTSRIQECHILIGHIICELADTHF